MRERLHRRCVTRCSSVAARPCRATPDADPPVPVQAWWTGGDPRAVRPETCRADRAARRQGWRRPVRTSSPAPHRPTARRAPPRASIPRNDRQRSQPGRRRSGSPPCMAAPARRTRKSGLRSRAPAPSGSPPSPPAACVGLPVPHFPARCPRPAVPTPAVLRACAPRRRAYRGPCRAAAGRSRAAATARHAHAAPAAAARTRMADAR